MPDSEYNSWIMKAKLDATSGKLILSDPDTQSIKIKSGFVASIVELTENTLLMHFPPTDLLIARDWKVTNKILDPDSGNIMKYQLLPIMDYDQSFPFAILSGFKCVSILNIETSVMMPLIQTEVQTSFG